MKKLLKYTILTLTIILLAGCTVTVETKDANATSPVLQKDAIKVGMELEFAPYETIDKSGNPTGFSVAYIEELGKSLGKRIEIVPTKYDALIPALESGKIDMIISSMTITEEREKSVLFSEPYTTAPPLHILNSPTSNVKTLEEINQPNVTVAIKTGTIGAFWIQENAPLAKIKNFESMDAAVLDVAQSKSTITIYDPITIYSFQEQYPETTVSQAPVTDVNGWGIALPKGDLDLKEKVDMFIEKAKTDGTVDHLKKTYLEEEIKKFDKYKIPFIL
ncbi:MAG: transporter substrate-binding domain-containing protein [Mycoplasmatales bacterium]